MTEQNESILQYTPFNSFVHETFWHKLSELKIDVDHLSDKPRNIYGFYTNYNSKSCTLDVDYSAFNSNFKPPKYNFLSTGTIYNKNTIEEFKECDKNALLVLEGQKLIEDIKNGNVLNDTSLLSRFFILSFADLKIHKYYYWFGFPCPIQPVAKIIDQSITVKNSIINLESLKAIYNNLSDLEKSFFVLIVNGSDIRAFQLKDLMSVTNIEENFVNENLDNLYFCFSDPSAGPSPSWLLRVFVAFLHFLSPHLHEKVIKFVGIRISSQMSIDESILWNVRIPKFIGEENKFVGWEPNQNNKMGPRVASMADTMDPMKLAENSVLLNLKLMKWRLLPEINLEIMQKTKCLLFGAGTLGCSVTRNLLAWGFNHISYIDFGKVSFSNPVRQSLYKYEDAISGNKKKAETAAKRVLEINPNAVANGYVMQIPMPGHPVSEQFRNDVTKNIETIENLVKTHDVIFLLTDSRESRWLPSILAATYNKIVINAALGFDSYLVMRHGSRKHTNTQSPQNIGNLKCIPGNELGCYFCQDVTAPGDSQRDRTLDQQCTVTRPGVATIASSYAVELLVAILQHPDKDLVPAYISCNAGAGQSSENALPEDILGIIPHSIRGQLGTFENILPATMRFPQCIACSEKVINEFKQRKIDFLYDVFDAGKYLEDLTGITELCAVNNQILEFEDDDDWQD